MLAIRQALLMTVTMVLMTTLVRECGRGCGRRWRGRQRPGVLGGLCNSSKCERGGRPEVLGELLKDRSWKNLKKIIIISNIVHFTSNTANVVNA